MSNMTQSAVWWCWPYQTTLRNQWAKI